MDQNGQTITGYYAALRTSAGSLIAHGYTPTTFTQVTAGTKYEIELDSFGSCTFSHWQDTGASTDPRTVTATSGPTTFIGVYTCTTTSSVAAPASVGLSTGTLFAQFIVPAGLLASMGGFAVADFRSALSRRRSTGVATFAP